MIWVHSLFPLLLALAEAIDCRIRNIPNELIITCLCQGAAWAWMQPIGGLSVSSVGTLSGIVATIHCCALEGWA